MAIWAACRRDRGPGMAGHRRHGRLPAGPPRQATSHRTLYATEPQKYWFWDLQLVRHRQPEVHTCLPVSHSKGRRAVQRVLVERFGVGVKMTLPIPSLKVTVPRRSRRRARGRTSRPFLPAQSSSSQAPLPTRAEVHATRGTVYSLDSTSSPTWAAICASRQESHRNSRIPRRSAVRCRATSVVQGRPHSWHSGTSAAGPPFICVPEAHMNGG